MNSLIDWQSDSFGTAGINVHESSVASWLADRHGEEVTQS